MIARIPQIDRSVNSFGRVARAATRVVEQQCRRINQIESLVRQRIADALPVTFTVMPIEQARTLGAMALFSEKYGDNVRVLAIGSDSLDTLEEAFSREFCGGTHVHNTRDIASFKITREESVATGVRRITAQTGRGLNEMLYQQSNRIDQLCQILKATPDQLADRPPVDGHIGVDGDDDLSGRQPHRPVDRAPLAEVGFVAQHRHAVLTARLVDRVLQAAVR